MSEDSQPSELCWMLFLGGRKDFRECEKKGKLLFFKRSCYFNALWPVAEATGPPEKMKERDWPSRPEGDSTPTQCVLESSMSLKVRN